MRVIVGLTPGSRHQDLGRPWLICIPGYGTGMPMIHFSAFDARWLHRDLSFWRETGVRMLIDDALRDSGFVSPR